MTHGTIKKLALALLIVFSASQPVLAKKRSSSSNRGTAHRMNKTHTNRTHTSGNKSCQVCDTNFATCMQSATNPQMQKMCSQMKDQCRGNHKC